MKKKNKKNKRRKEFSLTRYGFVGLHPWDFQWEWKFSLFYMQFCKVHEPVLQKVMRARSLKIEFSASTARMY